MLKLRLAGAAFILLSVFALDRAEAKKECPTQNYQGGCIQVITYARNPQTGTCCEYPNPCVVPSGWTQYSDPACTVPR
jgi:hypothetical protein